MVVDSCRVAESTIQLRSLLQSIPEHPLMPDNRRLVAAIYLIAIKAFIQERECKEAMDLCEMMSSAFSCEGWLLMWLHSTSHCVNKSAVMDKS